MSAKAALQFIEKKVDKVDPVAKFMAYTRAAFGEPRTYGDKRFAMDLCLYSLESMTRRITATEESFYKRFVEILFDV